MLTILLVIGIIIASLFALILIVMGVIAVCLRKHVGSLSSTLNMIKSATEEAESTPKTLSTVEGVYMQQIKKDFPEFDLNLVKSYIKSFAMNYFSAMTAGKVDNSLFERNCSRQFIEVIRNQATQGNRYEQVKVHNVVIQNYKKSVYDVNVIFAIAVEYRHNGRSNRSQERYEVSYTYFLEDGVHQEISSMKCPNCGAPIETVDRSYCPYCDYKLDVHEEAIVIERKWKITDFKKG